MVSKSSSFSMFLHVTFSSFFSVIYVICFKFCCCFVW
jgi:hypothetical protein